MPWQSCSENYSTLLILSIFFFILYTLGIPTLFGALLFKARHSIHSRETRDILGFFYNNYSPKFYYAEIFWILRNFAITASYSLLTSDKSAQGFLVQGILLASVIGGHYLHVFQYFLENLLHSVAVAILLLCYNATLWTDKISTTAAWMCGIVSVGFVAIVIVLVIRTKLYEKYFNKHMND